MDLQALLQDAWPWIWPTLALVAWAALFSFGAHRWERWVARRVVTAEAGMDDRVLERMVRIFLIGMLLLGIYLWILVVPMPEHVKQVVQTDVRPWIWGTVLFVVFLVVGIYAVRRALVWFSQQVMRSETRLDDALVHALRRPLIVTVVLLGVNLWASIVPMPQVVADYVAVGSEATVVILIIMLVDGVVQGWMIARESKSKVFQTSGVVLRTSARVAIYTIGILMVLSAMKIDVTPILASLGVTSIAIGLALQSTLEDFLAGLLLAADRPIIVGDFIELESGLSGVVLSIGWRTTRILTREDMHVIVPNSKLAKSTVVNRSRPGEHGKFTVAIGVTYDSELSHVVRITGEVANALQSEDSRAVTSYRPRVVFGGFGESSVDFSVWLCAVSWEDHFGMRSEFIRRLHARYVAEAIEIAFPTRTLKLSEADLAALPHGPVNVAADQETA